MGSGTPVLVSLRSYTGFLPDCSRTPKISSAEGPVPENGRSESGLSERFALSEGQLINARCDNVVANIEDTRSVIALSAIYVLRCIRFAASHRAIVFRVRVSVLESERESRSELAIEGDVQGVEAAIAVVALQIDLLKSRQGSQTRSGIDEVLVSAGE